MVEVNVNTQLMTSVLTGIRESSGHDISRFAALMRFHRISGRSLEVAAELGDVLSEDEWRAVKSVREEEMNRIDQTLETIRAISPKIANEDTVIHIKGTSVAEHLGTRSSRLRPSSDIDLVCGNVGFLGDAGYQFLQPGICHEVGTYSHSVNLKVDTHAYLPSWQTGGGRIRAARISTEIMRRHSAPSHLWSGRARIPAVTLAAVIICCHLYVDYIEHPIFREAPVRFVEVFEFDELRRHPDFDIGLFRQLTEEVGGDEAESFVEAVIKLLNGVETKYISRIEVARGVLTDLTLDRSALFDVGRLIEAVTRASRITLSAAAGSSVVVSRSHALEGALWSRLAVSGDDPEVLATLTRSEAEGVVHLDITAKLASRHYKDELRLTLGTGSFAIQRQPSTGSIDILRSGPQDWTVTSSAVHGELGLHIELKLRPGSVLNAIVSAHSFPVAITDDWNYFYEESLASSCMLLQILN